VTARRPNSKLHVLLAEDDPEMRTLVADALRRDGFEIEEVEDGRQLWIRTLNPGGYDLVVSDVRLPIVDGLSVIEDLRGRGDRTAVILMTAFGDDTTHARAAEYAALLFDKPFEIGELRAAARRLCEEAALRGPS
jgi:DNA-binding response OmpR family regulator